MRALIWSALGLAAVLGLAATDANAAPARKARGKPTATKVVAKPPPPSWEASFDQIPIQCGAPLQVAKPEAKGLLAKAASVVGKGAKLPETCILVRFKDPAFPVGDPNSPATSLADIFSGHGAMRANYPRQEEIARETLNFLARTGPRPDVRASVAMADAPMAFAQALFTSPGDRDGAIVISNRLLRDLTEGIEPNDSREYIWFVVAHEYAHLLLKHPHEFQKTNSSYDDIRKIFQGAALAYAIYNGVKMGPNATSVEQQLVARQSAAMFVGASLIGDMAASEGRRLGFPNFSKAREREADLLAVDLLAHTNAQVMIGVAGLKRVRTVNEESIKAARQQAMAAKKTQTEASLQLAAMTPLLLLQKDQGKAMKQIKAIGITLAADALLRVMDERKQMSDVSLHDDPVAREALVGAYVRAHYPSQVRAADKPSDLLAAGSPPPVVKMPELNLAAIAAENAAVDATRVARDALSQGRIPEARAAIDKALKTSAGASADVQDVAGIVAAAENKPDQAIKHYRAVLATGHHNDRIYRNIASAQQQKGDIPGALKTLAEGADKIGSIRPFIVARIALQVEAGDTAGAEASLQECVATKDPMLITVCTQTAHPEAADAEADKQVAKGESGDTQIGGALGDALLKKLGGKK